MGIAQRFPGSSNLYYAEYLVSLNRGSQPICRAHGRARKAAARRRGGATSSDANAASAFVRTARRERSAPGSAAAAALK
jgi:hypothetical protein